MGVIYNWPDESGSIPTYANLAAFPATAEQGALGIALDSGFLYEFIGASWVPIAGPGSILSVGTFDSGTASAEGAHIDLNQLIMQSASATVPGLVNLTAQSFDGKKTFLDGLDANGNAITGVLDPTGAQDAATKQYVDNLASGIKPVQAVRAASTADIVGTYDNGASGVGATLTVTATGAFVLDGISLALNDRILLKDQSNTPDNGIYVVTDPGSLGVQPIFTRATDFDSPAKINNGDLVPVIFGTANAQTSWLQDSTVTTVGTSPITFFLWSYNPNNFISSIGTINSQTKSANGAVKSGMTLVLQTADGTFPGLLSVADYATFSAKQPAGNYITALTGDVTASGPGSAAATIANDAITTAKILNSAVTNDKIANGTIDLPTKVTGLLANTNGGTGVNSSAFTGVAKVAAGVWSASTIISTDISVNAVTNTRLNTMPGNTIKGNNSGGTNNASDLTAAQVTSMLSLFTASNKGLVPISTGTSTDFMRADGVWAVPSTTPLTGPTIQTLSGSGTYTKPAGVLYIRVVMVGGGAGGAGSGDSPSGGSAGTDGTASTFGTTLLVANGGVAAAGGIGADGGVGGTASLGTGPIGLAIKGGSGGGGGAMVQAAGGNGGSNLLGGGGNGGTNGAGGAPIALTGGGGQGHGGSATAFPGAGGGAGGYIDAIINTPSATYPYVVGSAGALGAAGSNGGNGTNGAAGTILVYEFYQ